MKAVWRTGQRTVNIPPKNHTLVISGAVTSSRAAAGTAQQRSIFCLFILDSVDGTWCWSQRVTGWGSSWTAGTSSGSFLVRLVTNDTLLTQRTQVAVLHEPRIYALAVVDCNTHRHTPVLLVTVLIFRYSFSLVDWSSWSLVSVSVRADNFRRSFYFVDDNCWIFVMDIATKINLFLPMPFLFSSSSMKNTDIHTHRQTDRQTDRQTNRHMPTHTDRSQAIYLCSVHV